jgi:ADP-heptose:LPS heptosyltransferase
MFNTPVLYLIFNRPDVTRITFERLRELKPSKLYVAADGARAHKPGEAALCEQTRAIIKDVDWPCEVKTLFRDQNLGCGNAVSDAITWFFKEEERGIIIEDDCLPDLSFFQYCEELLEKYKNDERVFHIGGVNFQNGQKRGEGDYYFSAVAHVWGWASWRRAWNKYKFDIPQLDKFISEDKLGKYFDNKIIKNHWTKTFVNIEKHETDTWDHQWTYCIYNNGGLSIIPNQNMVSNIGFGADATHTTTSNQYANIVPKPIQFPLKHPKEVKQDKEADLYFFTVFDKLIENSKFDKIPLSYKIKNKIVTGIESYLRKNVLPKIHKNPNQNILLVKPDAIGDMFICQWLFQYLDKYPDFKNNSFYLLANIRLKSYLDVNKPVFIKEVIYYDQSIHKHFKPLYNFYFQLRKYKFKAVYNLIYSRTLNIDEIVHYTGSPLKVGFVGDTANIKTEQKKITDSYYNSLFTFDGDLKKIFHESEMVKFFFEEILKTKLPSFSDSYLKPLKPASNTVLFCPGSNEDYKKWNPIHYAQLIQNLKDQHPDLNYKVMCGPGEEHLGDIIKNHCKSAEIINMKDINKLIGLVNESLLVVSNDSAPVHIAIAYGRPFICIFNGSRYGRFIPYLNISNKNYITIMPDVVDEDLKDEQRKLFYHQNKVDVNINAVKLEKVLAACKTIVSVKV